MKLSGWGRYPVLEARTHRPRSVDALRDLVLIEPSLIARGNGRAYGDSAINASATIETRHLNRVISFDPDSGQLVAEAGVLLGDIIAAFLPRGWFPMVTPGTKFVTLGGAIAADVHGKNHHKDGSFRTCVDWIDVMGLDGEIRRCTPQDDATLFDYTLGGMGLTGIILRAAIRLRSVETAWIRQTTIAAPNLKAAMAAFEAAQDATYSVAWIDCLGTGGNLGRSLVMLGEHATRNDLSPDQGQAPFRIKPKRKLSVPIDVPAFALNRLTVRAFNALYYWAGARKTGRTPRGLGQLLLPARRDPWLEPGLWPQRLRAVPVRLTAGPIRGRADRAIGRDRQGRVRLIPRSTQALRQAGQRLFLPDGRLHAGAGFPGHAQDPRAAWSVWTGSPSTMAAASTSRKTAG